MTAGLELQLHWARPTAHHTLEAMLSVAEVGRLDRLVSDDDRAQRRSAHVLARVAVATELAVSIEEVDLVQCCATCGGTHGRPRAEVAGRRAPEISLAYASGVVVVATCAAPVGVDVEPRHRPVRAGDVILSDGERAQLDALAPADRAAATLRWWVRKEAVLKAVGIGLDLDPSEIEITPPGTPARIVGWPGPAPTIVLADVDLPAEVVAAAAVVGVGDLQIAVREVELTEVLS